MGEVWQAHSVRLDRPVAIKRVNTEIPWAHAQLVQEAQTLAKLRHPSIVQVFDVVYDAEQTPYIVMELLVGRDLRRVLSQDGPVPQRRGVELFLGAASGLSTAHRNGVVHGDVKLGNIFLEGEGMHERAVLLDFGISHPAGADPSTMALAGTPEYLAPEQTQGTIGGPAADQWALCVAIFGLIAGRLPFQGDTVPELFRVIREARLPFPRDVPFDPRLFGILARGTRKDPQERYPSMSELHKALRQWVVGQRHPTVP